MMNYGIHWWYYLFMTTTLENWVNEFAEALNLGSVSQEDIDSLLDIAGIAAHTSARTAAPITCWLIGKSGKSPQEALEIARSLEVKFSSI